MTIKIVIPEGSNSTKGIRVYTESGAEIEGVSRIQLDMRACEMIEATITVLTSDIIGLEGLEGVVIVDKQGRALEGSEYD